MLITRILKYLCFSLLLSVTYCTTAFGQKSPDFSGDWTLRLGKRAFIVVSLRSIPGSVGHFRGSLVRPQHFSTSGMSFSGIEGPASHYPIVASTQNENCLNFTVQNPRDVSDKDKFQLCVMSEGHGTLKIDMPGFEGWPVTKEKGPIVLATDWNSARDYSLDETDVSNLEMKSIFGEDQRVRQSGLGEIDWKTVEKTDAARRDTTRKLLSGGKLHTGEDFERAAFVFQHGDSPDDYLLAHTLAIVAVARGQSAAVWIAAATLDRYLQSIHQQQIYGTQFDTPSDGPVMQEPYNRDLISDSLRRLLHVPSQAEQEQQRKQYEAEKPHP